MPYISTILARVLALTDWFLAQWVDITAVGSSLGAINNGVPCYASPTISANVNACGADFLKNSTDIVEGLAKLVPSILAGLFATPA
jgi:hypothetical protein